MKSKLNDIRILIVDDEPLIRESLYEILRIEGYGVFMGATGEEAVEILKKNEIDILVSDFKLPGMNGVQLLEVVQQVSPKTETILITGYGSIETAVEAMKKGAFDYITKPINDNEIKITIAKIIEKRELQDENAALKEILAKERRSKMGEMIGHSDKMQQVYHIIDSVASTNATILIEGESGTGKGLVARAIHEHDTYRKDKPFIEISCGALSETLLESELFGHAKGAFTGAIKDKEGRFEYANGGTIFLDEIDSFSLKLQVKLLRVLQDGVFERVGDNVTRKSNCRIVVATNQKLAELVAKGTFREDLFYRINVIAIHMPPLRERKEDLELLMKYFFEKYAANNNKKITGVDDQVLELLGNYHWPGNIRELENAVEGAVIMAKGEVVNVSDIPNLAKFQKAAAEPEADSVTLKKVVELPEKEHILNVLKECNWNRNKAAAALGVNRTTLYNKMKKYDIFNEAPRRT